MVIASNPLPAMITRARLMLIDLTPRRSSTELALMDEIVMVDVIVLLRCLQCAPAGTESKILSDLNR